MTEQGIIKNPIEAKTLIICQSTHHGNTLKIASVIANVLDAKIKKPSEVNSADLKGYDLIGFGSGIYNGKHHVSLFKLIENLERQNNKKVFIFSTATVVYKKMHTELKNELQSKGFDIINEFMCKGFMDYSFTKYVFGGLNKKRPNKKDLIDAKTFALTLKKKC